MKDKSYLYFIAKVVTVITSIFILSSDLVDITMPVISTLSFTCVFLLEILLDKYLKNKQVKISLVFLSMIACFALGLETFFPLFIILLTQLLDLLIENRLFYEILFVTILLSLFIFTPGKISIAMSFVLITLILFGRSILDKLSYYRELSDHQKDTISDLSKRIEDVKSLMKTIKYTTSLEERNRIAARIHDQIGHGISGSIIMLEASLLVMKDNPVKAAESIQKTINNLRSGVDEIRMALREERAGSYVLGVQDILTVLEEFKVSFNKAVHLDTKGSLDLIRIDIWACIHENLKECLTNLLKHSNATEFQLTIEVFKKMVKVEYRDNGRSEDGFDKGLGLEAMEERTVHAKGRCFFNKGENGFIVTNIFSL
ncbi:MAG: hypothetical protein K0S47_1373 [Herbinix sp.]|jgi:signal transduction histidine kinase|nr:hypothetical protein [Herbinix sp.]